LKGVWIGLFKGDESILLVFRVTGEGYILIDEAQRENVMQELMEQWDLIFEEARWGAIDHAMVLYSKLFEWVDKLGKRVRRYRHGADIVLPPRDLDIDELKSLLGPYER